MDQQTQQVISDMESQHADQYYEFVLLEEDFTRACAIVRDILFDDGAAYDSLIADCARHYSTDRDRVVKVCEHGITLLTTVGTPYFAFHARNLLLKFMMEVKGKTDHDLLTSELFTLADRLNDIGPASKVKDVNGILYQAFEAGSDLASVAKSALRILNDSRLEELSNILSRHACVAHTVA